MSNRTKRSKLAAPSIITHPLCRSPGALDALTNAEWDRYDILASAVGEGNMLPAYDIGVRHSAQPRVPVKGGFRLGGGPFDRTLTGTAVMSHALNIGNTTRGEAVQLYLDPHAAISLRTIVDVPFIPTPLEINMGDWRAFQREKARLDDKLTRHFFPGWTAPSFPADRFHPTGLPSMSEQIAAEFMVQTAKRAKSKLKEEREAAKKTLADNAWRSYFNEYKYA